ncbi:hypothetical protein HAX54_009831 [Datura stramonium]|uniref:Uncharacterized protein n=1 Tax=Datura stramonium TaxID=4076 RepID=A0ABS8WY51_DATST|nr:hypothetical protein [Datura stramonium]
MAETKEEAISYLSMLLLKLMMSKKKNMGVFSPSTQFCSHFPGISSNQFFLGKGRRDLVMEGKKLTAEITGFVVRVLIREGNLVAAICAAPLGIFALVRRNKQEATDYSVE